MPQRNSVSALLFPTASEHCFSTLHYTVREVAPYINWIYYFHAWGMEPRFAAIADVHNCPSCRASWKASVPAEEQAKAREAAKLYDEAKQLLRQWADEPICHAIFRLTDAYSEGDDIIVDGGVRIPFLRQQHVGRSGYTLCLSDFIRGAHREDEDRQRTTDNRQPTTNREQSSSLELPRCEGGLTETTTGDSPLTIDRCPLSVVRCPLNPTPTNDIANTIGLFATTVSQPPLNAHLSSPNLDYVDLKVQLSTLSDRLAEATAEKMHEEVRKHHWGYAKDEQLTMRELHEERFQGIRPAVGYPSLPDQSINFLIDELLPLSEIGITLSENGAMSPHCSVSGLMFAHPKAHYFSVGHISEEQLLDYARRRGITPDQAKKFLASMING